MNSVLKNVIEVYIATAMVLWSQHSACDAEVCDVLPPQWYCGHSILHVMLRSVMYCHRNGIVVTAFYMWCWGLWCIATAVVLWLPHSACDVEVCDVLHRSGIVVTAFCIWCRGLWCIATAVVTHPPTTFSHTDCVAWLCGTVCFVQWHDWLCFAALNGHTQEKKTYNLEATLLLSRCEKGLWSLSPSIYLLIGKFSLL